MAKRKRRTFTPEFKSKIVIKALNSQSSETEKSSEYGSKETRDNTEYAVPDTTCNLTAKSCLKLQ